MAANRLLRSRDRRAQSAHRAARAGERRAPAGAMLWAIAAGLALLLWSAWMLNPLCVKLMPIAALLLLIYPLCKRFTWALHFVLGAVDGLAPLGAYIGDRRHASRCARVAALCRRHDLGRGLRHHLRADGSARRPRAGHRSLPARFGEASGRVLPIALHVAMLLLLAWRRRARAAPDAPYYCGVAAAAVLVLYEEHLFRSGANLFVINERVFISNMAFSVVFLAHDRRRASGEAPRRSSRPPRRPPRRGIGAARARRSSAAPNQSAVSAAAHDRGERDALRTVAEVRPRSR